MTYYPFCDGSTARPDNSVPRRKHFGRWPSLFSSCALEGRGMNAPASAGSAANPAGAAAAHRADPRGGRFEDQPEIISHLRTARRAITLTGADAALAGAPQ